MKNVSFSIDNKGIILGQQVAVMVVLSATTTYVYLLFMWGHLTLQIGKTLSGYNIIHVADSEIYITYD